MLVTRIPDEALVGSAEEVLLGSEEKDDGCSGMFEALPSFDDNFSGIDEICSVPVGKAVEVCFAVEDALDRTPDRCVALLNSDLRETRV